MPSLGGPIAHLLNPLHCRLPFPVSSVLFLVGARAFLKSFVFKKVRKHAQLGCGMRDGRCQKPFNSLGISCPNLQS